jgi:uncharacterized membrane protein
MLAGALVGVLLLLVRPFFDKAYWREGYLNAKLISVVILGWHYRTRCHVPSGQHQSWYPRP